MVHLEQQIKNLQKDSLVHLKYRLNELGMSAETPADFLCKAKEIVLKHKELQAQSNSMQDLVGHLEKDQQGLVCCRVSLYGFVNFHLFLVGESPAAIG